MDDCFMSQKWDGKITINWLKHGLTRKRPHNWNWHDLTDAVATLDNSERDVRPWSASKTWRTEHRMKLRGRLGLGRQDLGGGKCALRGEWRNEVTHCGQEGRRKLKGWGFRILPGPVLAVRRSSEPEVLKVTSGTLASSGSVLAR